MAPGRPARPTSGGLAAAKARLAVDLRGAHGERAAAFAASLRGTPIHLPDDAF